MKQEQVQLDQILLDSTFQVRKDINSWVVSRLVQVLKSGNDFQDRIVILPDGRTLAGFHRVCAYRKVLAPQASIDVLIYEAESDEDAYQFAVKSNVAHGEPLQEFDKKSIRRRLHEMEWKDEDVSKFLGVSLERFQEWDAEQVYVLDGKQKQRRDVKRGTKMPQRELTEQQYEEHVEHHAISTIFHARKVIGRIKDDTIEKDNQTWEILRELKSLLNEVLENGKAV